VTTEQGNSAAETTPPAAASTTTETPAATPPASGPVPQDQPAVAVPAVSDPDNGSKPVKRGLIGWLNFYAEDLLAPITRQRPTCERCKRKMWRGYLLSAPTTGVKGVSDIQIVCWRCKLSAAQQEMERLRTSGRR
jgi:hypothetical protein